VFSSLDGHPDIRSGSVVRGGGRERARDGGSGGQRLGQVSAARVDALGLANVRIVCATWLSGSNQFVHIEATGVFGVRPR